MKAPVRDLHSLVSKHDQFKVSELEEQIEQLGAYPSLFLIGVDSNELAKAVIFTLNEKSPLPVKTQIIRSKKKAFPILRDAEKLDPGELYIFSFFNYTASPLTEIASNLIFYRDYIPSRQLKIVIISSHEFLTTLIERAYDFYSIAVFTGFFTDQSKEIAADLDLVKKKSLAETLFETSLDDLNNYRKQKDISEAVLLNKLFITSVMALDISRLDASLNLSRQALEIAERIGNKQYVAKISVHMGVIFRRKEELKIAREFFQEGLKIAEEIDDLLTQADALTNLGIIERNEGRWKEALKIYNKVLEITRASRYLSKEAEVLGYIGTIQRVEGNLEIALENFNRALDLAKETDDKEQQAVQYNNLASLYQDKGDPSQSLLLRKKALDIFKESGNKKGQAAMLNNIGKLYEEIGELDNALKYYRRALEINEHLDYPVNRSTTLENIAIVYRQKGMIQESLGYLQEALRIYRSMGFKQKTSFILNTIGRIYDDLRDWSRASKYYEEALEIDREIGNIYYQSYNLVNLGIMHKRMGNPGKALEYCENALALAKGRYPLAEAGAFSAIAHLLLEKGEREKSLEYFKRSLKICREIKNLESEAKVLNDMGHFFLVGGDAQEALKYFRQSLEIAQKAGFPLIAAIAEHNINEAGG